VPVRTPAPATLKRYGLSEGEWKGILDAQGGVCAICEVEPKKERLCIDHFHEKGWKKLPPELRKTFVRGLVCWFCNHYLLGRGVTIKKAENVVRFLRAYEERRANLSSPRA